MLAFQVNRVVLALLRRDAVNLSRPEKAKHDDAEGKPGGMSGKDLAKGVQGAVVVSS